MCLDAENRQFRQKLAGGPVFMNRLKLSAFNTSQIGRRVTVVAFVSDYAMPSSFGSSGVFCALRIYHSIVSSLDLHRTKHKLLMPASIRT